MRVLLLAALLAALTPLLAEDDSDAAPVAVPAWPHEFQGRPLTPLPMTEQDRRFLAGFPGAVARFTDGERNFILRWVTQPTRKLHPAEDCYRGIGYDVGEARIHADRDGAHWRCFEVTRDGRTHAVCEQLRDVDGAHWTDVSSWYWAATLRRTHGPWLAVTMAD